MKANTRINLFIKQLPSVAAALFAAVLCISTAQAGMEPKSMEIPQAEPFTWTGFYFDLGAGVVLTDFDQDDFETTVDLIDQFDNQQLDMAALSTASSNRFAAPRTPSGDGVTTDFAFFGVPGHSDTDLAPMVGFDVGYMKQWGHFVVGGFVGFYGTHAETSQHVFDSQTNFILIERGGQSPIGREFEADTDFESKRRVEQTWSGYVGGQLGYAMDHWLFYATGGAAFAQIEVRQVDRAFTEFFFSDQIATSVPQQGPGFVGSTDSRNVQSRGSVQDGWFAGAGVMYAFADNMSVGLEFKHAEFGDETYRFKEQNGIFPGKTQVDVDNNEILAKITFLLGSRLHK